MFHEVGATIEEDLVTAEMIALPITLVLLVLIFGSLVAASLPLIVGVMSIIGTFLVLQVLSGLTDVSVYALNLTTALGLGLAIDYSLFIVSRYREELRAGPRAARRGGPDRAHRRPDGRLQRPHGRRLAVRHARVPDRVPPQLRLRRRGGGAAGRGLLGGRAARHPRPARPPGERPDPVAALGHAARGGLLAPGRHAS